MLLKNATLFKQQAYLDGAWIGADSGATLEVRNPSTGAVLGRVPNTGATEARDRGR
jgi:succinate-semialdehyde dehydrogenase/glutarate-semialdehyde dehydrogenase